MTGPSRRGTELGVAALAALFGAVSVMGSLQAGIGWGAEGPRSGFFPFYLGLIVIGASAINLTKALRTPDTRLFAEWTALRQVVAVVIPTAIYVAVIPWIGIYLASFLLITGFMVRFGRYPAHWSAGLAASVVVIVYVTFERWFLVPLPKGPIEDFLGL